MGTYSRRVDSKSRRIIYKEIQLENGDTLRFYGANRSTLLRPCYTGEHEGDSFFFHYGRKYYLSEFLLTKRNPWGNAPEYLQEFDGYMNDSLFSGVVIKIDDTGESVKAFTFY